jgi:hypothetical protein
MLRTQTQRFGFLLATTLFLLVGLRVYNLGWIEGLGGLLVQIIVGLVIIIPLTRWADRGDKK